MDLAMPLAFPAALALCSSQDSSSEALLLHMHDANGTVMPNMGPTEWGILDTHAVHLVRAHKVGKAKNAMGEGGPGRGKIQDAARIPLSAPGSRSRFSSKAL